MQRNESIVLSGVHPSTRACGRRPKCIRDRDLRKPRICRGPAMPREGLETMVRAHRASSGHVRYNRAMNDSPLAVRKLIVGIISLGCLATAGGLWIFADDPVRNPVVSVTMRLGIMLGAL